MNNFIKLNNLSTEELIEFIEKNELNASLLAKLIDSGRGFTFVKRVLRSNNVTGEKLHIICKKLIDNYLVTLRLVESPKILPKTLEMYLINNNIETYLKEIILNKKDKITPKAVAISLKSGQKWVIRALAASNESITLKQIEKYFNDPDYFFRASLVQNPKMPIELLRKAMDDHSVLVRSSAVLNNNIDDTIIEKAIEDNQEVRNNLVRRHQLDLKYLKILVKNKQPYSVVYNILIYQKNITDELLLYIYKKYSDKNLKYEIIQRENVPNSIVRIALKSKHWYVRDQALQTKHVTLTDILTALNDVDAYVKDTALSILKNEGKLRVWL